MTGLAVGLGNDRAQHETYIQVADRGLRISAASLREQMNKLLRCIVPCCATRMCSFSRQPRPRSPTAQQNGGALGSLAFDGRRSHRRR